MLDAYGGDADEVIGVVAPRDGEATPRTIAANAVMAGCLPEYFPVVVAAVSAVSDPAFGLHGPTATTHGAAILMIVNGPIIEAIGLNSG